MNVTLKQTVIGKKICMMSLHSLTFARFLSSVNVCRKKNSVIEKTFSIVPAIASPESISTHVVRKFHASRCISDRQYICHSTPGSVLKRPALPAKKSVATGVAFCQRWFKTTARTERLTPDDLRKRVDSLTECFAEARELLGDARESLGTSYFSEDMMEAQEAVSSTVAKYKALLKELDEDQRNDVVRTIGLRMEELKAQEQAIKDLLS